MEICKYCTLCITFHALQNYNRPYFDYLEDYEGDEHDGVDEDYSDLFYDGIEVDMNSEELDE
jgi:hypothetical protein